jgi:hypothetical protein
LKNPSKDFVLIAVALFAILGCGYGLGKRFAPIAVEIDPAPLVVEDASFEDLTLSKLSEVLGLTKEQIADIRPEIEATNDKITASRKKALFEFYLHIRELHEKMDPTLDPAQQEKLRKSRDTLQKVIEKRFPRLLGKLDSTTGGGSKNRD